MTNEQKAVSRPGPVHSPVNSGVLRTLRRLGAEFWLPAVIASCWTAWTWHETRDLKTAIAAFGTSFFLCAWATGQVVRVRRQTAVESTLSTIESRTQALDSAVSQLAAEVDGFNTGGSAHPNVELVVHRNHAQLLLRNDGRYPLLDIRAGLVNLYEANGSFCDARWAVVPHLHVARMESGARTLWDAKLTCHSNNLPGRYRVWLSCRSSKLELRVVLVARESRILAATWLAVNRHPPKFTIPEGFPGWDEANPEGLFPVEFSVEGC